MSEQNNIGNNKRIAKNTIFLYIRLLISLCIGLYTGRAILDALGVSDYGVYNVVVGFVSMLSILTGNLRSASTRFITFELGTGKKDRLRRTFATLNVVSLVFAAVVFVIGETVGPWLVRNFLDIPTDRIETAIWVFQFSLVAFMIDLWAIPYSAVVNAHEHMNFFALIGILESIARLGIVFLLYTTMCDRLLLYSILMLCVSVSVRIVWGLYCNRNFAEVQGGLLFDKQIFKSIFSYSVWVMIGTSSSVVKEQGVNILINKFFGVLMNAPRGLALQITGVLGQFSNNIGAAIIPQITKSYASGDIKRSVTLTNAMLKAQCFLLLIIGLPVFIEIDYILKLWLKEVPLYTSTFAQWAIILILARTIHNSQVPLLLAIGKVKVAQICGGSIILFNIPIGIIALQLDCPAVSTMMIGSALEIVAALNTSIFIKKYEPYSISVFFIKSVFPIVVIALLTYYIVDCFKCIIAEDSLFGFVLIFILSTFTLTFFEYIILLNQRERLFVKQFIKKRIHR